MLTARPPIAWRFGVSSTAQASRMLPTVTGTGCWPTGALQPVEKGDLELAFYRCYSPRRSRSPSSRR